MASRYCLLAMTITEILPMDRAVSWIRVWGDVVRTSNHSSTRREQSHYCMPVMDINLVLQMLQHWTSSDHRHVTERCDAADRCWWGTLHCIIPLSVAELSIVFSSLRVFALLDRNYLIAGGVFLIGLIPVGTAIVTLLFAIIFVMPD